MFSSERNVEHISRFHYKRAAMFLDELVFSDGGTNTIFDVIVLRLCPWIWYVVVYKRDFLRSSFPSNSGKSPKSWLKFTKWSHLGKVGPAKGSLICCRLRKHPALVSPRGGWNKSWKRRISQILPQAEFAAATTKAARKIVKEAKEWTRHGEFSIHIITTTSDTSAARSSCSVYI